MVKNVYSIGRAVAYLSVALESGPAAEIIKQVNVDFYEYVCGVYENMRQSGAGVLDQVPAKQCLEFEPFLQENDHYFIAHVLVEQKTGPVEHNRLLKHLNDCFSCFRTYSQFFRGYYHGLQEARELTGR